MVDGAPILNLRQLCLVPSYAMFLSDFLVLRQTIPPAFNLVYSYAITVVPPTQVLGQSYGFASLVAWIGAVTTRSAILIMFRCFCLTPHPLTISHHPTTFVSYLFFPLAFNSTPFNSNRSRRRCGSCLTGFLSTQEECGVIVEWYTFLWDTSTGVDSRILLTISCRN